MKLREFKTFIDFYYKDSNAVKKKFNAYTATHSTLNHRLSKQRMRQILSGGTENIELFIINAAPTTTVYDKLTSAYESCPDKLNFKIIIGADLTTIMKNQEQKDLYKYP